MRARCRIVDRLAEGWPASALALGRDPGTARDRCDRFAAEGLAGLADGSPRPPRSPTRLDEAAGTEIARLRPERLSGPAIASRGVTRSSIWLENDRMGSRSARREADP